MDRYFESNGKRRKFAIICELCKHISIGRSKYGKGPRDTNISRVTKSTTSGVCRVELGNLFENFKTNVLGTLSVQLDTLKIHSTQKVKNIALSIICPRCRKNILCLNTLLITLKYVLYV